MHIEPRSRAHGAALLAGALVLAACGRRDIPVEHVKYDEATDQFGLGVTEVSTFLNRLPGDGVYEPDVRGLEGEHVVVKGGGMLLLNLCRGAPDAHTVTREEYYQQGVVQAPRRVSVQTVNAIDGTYQATEHDSLSMLTAYVNFDRVRAFYRDVVGDRTPATETRAVLAFYGDLAIGCGIGPFAAGLPVSSVDNAAYVSNADLFIILRDASLATGVELGANPGVAAHEFGHRIFHHNVYRSDAAFRMLALSVLGTAEEQKALCTDEAYPDNRDCDASPILLKGMDEGTADVFAYTFTGKPDFFFSRSIDPVLGVAEAHLRDLSREPVVADGELPIYRDEVKEAARTHQLQFYRLGTLWSRGFRAGIVDPATGRGPVDEAERVKWAREHYAPAVLRAELRLGEDFTAPVGDRPYNTRFDPRQMLRRYVEEVSRDPATGAALPQVRAAVCQELCDRFGEMDVPQILNGAPAQCGGVVGRNEYAMNGLGVFPCTL